MKVRHEVPVSRPKKLPPPCGACMFADELRAVIRRYMQEADLSFYEIIGGIEIIKLELFEAVALGDIDEEL